jgi:hypothetical protein
VLFDHQTLVGARQFGSFDRSLQVSPLTHPNVVGVVTEAYDRAQAEIAASVV